MFKRTTAAFLCILMILSAASLGAFAAVDEPGEPADAQTIVLEVGEPAAVRYGQYVCIHASATGVPEGYYLGVFVNGEKAFRGSDNQSVDYRYNVDEYPSQPHSINAGPPFFGRYDLTPLIIALYDLFFGRFIEQFLQDDSVKNDFTYTITIVDASGNPLLDANGQQISKENQVTVSAGFEDRLVHFFNMLRRRQEWVDVGTV